MLRRYRRGGLAARASRDAYLWLGEARVRSFAEFRLTRALLARGLPVPRPVAASYVRDGMFYRASILVERLMDVRTLADRCAHVTMLQRTPTYFAAGRNADVLAQSAAKLIADSAIQISAGGLKHPQPVVLAVAALVKYIFFH